MIISNKITTVIISKKNLRFPCHKKVLSDMYGIEFFHIKTKPS